MSGAVFVERRRRKARGGINLDKSGVHDVLDPLDCDARLHIKLETSQTILSDTPRLYS